MIIIDMQNDFLHPDGGFGRRAQRQPKYQAGMSLLAQTVPMVKRLLDGFRRAGRPVVHVIMAHQPDYADAQWPHWRHGLTAEGREFLIEGSWGARIIDELTPQRGEYVVVKKGYGGFANPALNTILRSRDVTNLCRCRSEHGDLRVNDSARRRRKQLSHGSCRGRGRGAMAGDA